MDSSWDAHTGLVAPGVRGLPGPGIRLVSAAVQGGFSTTGHQGGPALILLLLLLVYCSGVMFGVTVPFSALLTPGALCEGTSPAALEDSCPGSSLGVTSWAQACTVASCPGAPVLLCSLSR